MNANERRAARRKAEQQQQQAQQQQRHQHQQQEQFPPQQQEQQQQQQQTTATSNSKARAISSNPVDPGMTAKERRAAKRAAERAASTAAETAPAPAATATTAKERRAAKRAAARDAGTLKTATTASPPPPLSTPTEAAPTAGTGAMNAKERRLLRREEERKKRERELGGGDGGISGGAPPAKRAKGAAGKRGGGHANPFIVFVGQLAFSTTAEAIEEHFRTRGGIEGKISVRLLTRKGTNPPRSKGMAFVEVEDAVSAYKCLGLHHSRLDGRLLNVERTSGGGKEKKVKIIQEKRGEQKEFMKSVVQRVLGEFIDAGRLGKTELDEAAQAVLEKMEAKVMERAVKDYCDKPDRLDLHNPSAWFTHHAHELCFRSDPEGLDAAARDWLNDERVKAAGRGRDKELAVKKARGERANAGGGSGTGWVSRGGGSRVMGRGRGAFRAGRGRGGDGDAAAGGSSGGGDGDVKIEPTSAPSGVADQAAGGGECVPADDGAAARGKWARFRPSVNPAAARRGAAGRDGGSGGGEGGESQRHRQQRDTSDLLSIFPSLRGRGRGRGGVAGGRGGGGRGFRQGGIPA